MNDIVYKYLMIGSMVGGVGCMAAILAYSFRGVLRRLLEQWLKLGPVGRSVSLLVFSAFFVYGSTKETGSGGSGGLERWGESLAGKRIGDQGLGIRDWGLGLDSQTGKRNPFRLGETEKFLFQDEADRNPLLLCTPTPHFYTSQPPVSQTFQTSQTFLPWSSRGAWCDWLRVEFPSSFSFPVGTNLVSGVTVMAYGELRESLRFAAPLFALPAAVSLEPGVSAFSHGLSASNSYVFAWTDCCVEREATNRVDASVELFMNGDAVVRFGESVTNIVAALPEGYVGEGQDDDWARAAFSESDYAAITNKGYETWLMEDCVGINEQNGIYKISVTIDTVPTDGPFYLLCGPWKTVIKQPGTYSFPLHVRTDYTIRTFPTPVPLTFSRDHGYRCDDPDPYGYMMAAARRAAPPRPEQPIYNEREEPTLFATPHSIPVASAEDKELSMYFNDTGSRQYSYETNGDAILTFTGNKALIRRARVAQRVRIKLMQDGVTYDDEVELFDRYYPPWDGDHSSTNGTNESSSTNGTGNASSTNSNNSATSP